MTIFIFFVLGRGQKLSVFSLFVFDVCVCAFPRKLVSLNNFLICTAILTSIFYYYENPDYVTSKTNVLAPLCPMSSVLDIDLCYMIFYFVSIWHLCSDGVNYAHAFFGKLV